MTRQEWIRRARRSLRSLDQAVHGQRPIGRRDRGLAAIRLELRSRLAELEQEAWPSAAWHSSLSPHDDLVRLLARAERGALSLE